MRRLRSWVGCHLHRLAFWVQPAQKVRMHWPTEAPPTAPLILPSDSLFRGIVDEDLLAKLRDALESGRRV